MKNIPAQAMIAMNEGIVTKFRQPADINVTLSSSYNKIDLDHMVKEANKINSIPKRAAFYFYNLVNMHPFKSENILTAVAVTEIYVGLEHRKFTIIDRRDLIELAWEVLMRQVSLEDVEKAFRETLTKAPTSRVGAY